MTPQERSMHDLRQSVGAVQGVLSGAQTVTIKGADGKTPKRGVDYLTPNEIAELQQQIGQLVIGHVMPRIRQPQDGKTPIPGVDYPTYDQMVQLVNTAAEQLKKDRKTAHKQLTSTIEKRLKDEKDKGIKWTEVKNKPDFDSMFAEMIAGGGPVLRVQDEGSTVSEHVTAINFIGSGVAATYNGNGVIAVTISASATDFAENETPSGTVNGANDTFTLANTPSPAASLQLYVNGQLQTAGGEDYTLATATITFTAGTIPETGDIIRCWYRY